MISSCEQGLVVGEDLWTAINDDHAAASGDTGALGSPHEAGGILRR